MEIGSRLELFVDHYLIEEMGGLDLLRHSPQLAAPSPSPVQGYYMTILEDGGLYRAYYRDYVAGYQGPYENGSPGEITCYAESRDGRTWKHPQTGLCGVSGPQGKNVILAGEAPSSHNFSPFVDARPDVPAPERFKALGGMHQGGKGGLTTFTSRDGLSWTKQSETAVIRSARRAFDSQNVAFWSSHEECYVCYFRTWTDGDGGLRTVSRITSPDFAHWSAAVPMNCNAAGEHLYTNNTHPYYRAPHIYIATPTRFVPDRGDSTDIMFMTSRGGSRYDRLFMEAFIRPGLDRARWGNRSNYLAQNTVPTGPAEMSLYHAPSGARYVLRTDGFVSVHGTFAGGEMLTKSFRFSGRELVLNYSTSAAGSIRVEAQGSDGVALPGFGLSDCIPMVGDEIEGIVHWSHGASIGELEDKIVRLRFIVQDADLFSMRFRNPGAPP